MKWKENATQYEKATPGSHLARCYAVIDLGTQVGSFQGEVTHKRMVRLSFELADEKMEGLYNEKDKGKPKSVHLTTKQSLHPKANLRRFLEGWRGEKFTPEALEAFDPKKCVGLACRISLIENDDFINIDSISKVDPKKEKVAKQVNKSVYFSLDEFDPEVFKSLSEGTQKKVALSPEYKAIEGGGAGEEPQDGPGDVPPGEEEDDTPF